MADSSSTSLFAFLEGSPKKHRPSSEKPAPATPIAELADPKDSAGSSGDGVDAILAAAASRLQARAAEVRNLKHAAAEEISSANARIEEAKKEKSDMGEKLAEFDRDFEKNKEAILTIEKMIPTEVPLAADGAASGSTTVSVLRTALRALQENGTSFSARRKVLEQELEEKSQAVVSLQADLKAIKARVKDYDREAERIESTLKALPFSSGTEGKMLA